MTLSQASADTEFVAVRHLKKSYDDITAVEDLTFAVKPGEIIGLIGPNGAGKSSTIKILLDFIKPDSGAVEVFGRPMSAASKNRIGYLPEEKGLYKDLAAIDQIRYLASLKGMDPAVAEERGDRLLELTGMLENRKTKIKNMSKGMSQIIQFIVTIVHDPDLLILDEPFSGLDPVNTDIMKKIIADLRDAGKAIILSTHQMNQVEALCDRILMINDGRAIPGVVAKRLSNGSYELLPPPDVSAQMILDQLRARGTVINRFEITTPSLNEIFLKIAREEDE
jgi:ABC-2 type transport system ATP-binding protein